MICSRNTPTHVGKTSFLFPAQHSRQKHPHARGEDPEVLGKSLEGHETPPRTWGRHFADGMYQGVGGNTPTHVGKTPQGAALLVVVEKHPHARGEDQGAGTMRVSDIETPPRTWGRLSSASLRAFTF